jgi:hypothetical protein
LLILAAALFPISTANTRAPRKNPDSSQDTSDNNRRLWLAPLLRDASRRSYKED